MNKAIVWGAALIILTTASTAMAQNGYNNGYNGDGYQQRGQGYGGGYGGGNRDRGNAVNWRDNRRQLEAWFFTDRTEYQYGSGVRMRLTLTNLQDKMLTTTLQPTNGEYSILIRDMRTNKIVWARNRAQYRNGTLQISGNGTVQWSEIWDQRDNAGNPLPMGTYRIEANILGLPVSAQIFLADRSSGRPDPGTGNGNGNGGGNGGTMPPGSGTVPGTPNYPNPGGGTQPQGYQAIRGVLTLSRQSVQPGDTLRFTYTVANTSNNPVTLNFRNTQLFDAAAIPVTRTPTATRTPVWRFSEGMMWGQMLQSVTLQPGQSRTFTGNFRVPSQIVSGQSLDINAWMTPNNAPSGSVGTAAIRLNIN